MPFYKRKHHFFHVFFLLLLFVLFAVLSLFITLLGAKSYQQTIKQFNKNQDLQDFYSYVTETVHETDNPTPIRVQNRHDTSFLILESDVKGEPQYTCFYQYKKHLRKLTISSFKHISWSDGEKVMPASDFSAERCSDKLYKLTIWDIDKDAHVFYIASNAAL